MYALYGEMSRPLHLDILLMLTFTGHWHYCPKRPVERGSGSWGRGRGRGRPTLYVEMTRPLAAGGGATGRAHGLGAPGAGATITNEACTAVACTGVACTTVACTGWPCTSACDGTARARVFRNQSLPHNNYYKYELSSIERNHLVYK